MPQNNRQPIGVGLSALCWTAILGLLATLVWLASFDTLNADELYALALIGDVWTNVPFRWMLQPANGLFPGLVIAGVGFTAGLDGIGFYVFFAAAFSIVLFIGIIYFFRQAGLNTAHIWPGAAVGVMLICFASTQSLRQLLFCPACHAGVVAAALLAFALALEHVKHGKPSILWLFALVMLSTFSDVLTVPQLVLPIVAGMILLGWEQPQLRRPAAAVSLSVIIAALTGIALYFGAGRIGIVNHGDIPHWATSVHAAARTFVRTFGVLTSSLGIVYVGCVILGLAVGIFIAVQAIFFRQVSKDLAVILVASSALAGLVGPILTGVYSEVALFRYQLPFYTLPIIILVWLLCRLLPGRYWISMSAAAALSVVTVVKNANPAWQRPRVLNPSFVEVTDALQRLPADLTLAEYWSAKPIYIGSSRELMVCPIAADGSMFIWIANYGWCTEGLARWARHHNWLAVDVNDRVDRTAIVTIYGRPDREIVLQNHQLWLYSWSIERQSNLWRVICRPVTSFTQTPPCF